ncbi:MAG: beta-ketoacyl-[acyl-carrier-protein] synthase family protein, partial [Lentisphaerae bacterium]|nr:beta-ketoacyl-[acyl-carrier-protein] synthase family protein [Lentisphaerota bacterium]
MAVSIPITALAWSTPLGSAIDAVWKRLLAGETGLAPAPAGYRLRNDLAGMIPDVDLRLAPRERLRLLAERTIGQVRRAAGFSDRAPSRPPVPAGGIRLVIGTSFGSYLEDSPPAASAHAWADALARGLGLAEPPLVVSTACSSGSDAIALGAELIRAGEADCCICGGVDILTPAKRMNHSALQTLSPTTLRAFDVRHDGTVFGEGAG